MKTTHLPKKYRCLYYLLIIAIIMSAACSKEEKKQNIATGEVNKYLVSLPAWDIFSPTENDSDKEFEVKIDFNCEEKTVTKTTPCSITRTPAEIVTYDPNSEILYVGSLIQGKGYTAGLGSIKSLPVYQRAPLTLSISFQMSDNSRVVDNPNLANVKEAIGELIEAADAVGHVSGSSIFFNKCAGYSVEQLSLALGLSAKFMKSSVQANLDWSGMQEYHTVSAYFLQKMFTVSMVLPQRPVDIFSEDFTMDLLNEQVNLGRIGPDNLPVYVSNIVYGRMMTLTMTSRYSETEMKAALEASYNGMEGNVSAEHLKVLQNSEIRLVTIGGDANLALAYLRTGELGEFFREDAPLTTAVPISYTLRNLGDNEIAKVSETASYDMVQKEEVQIELVSNESAWLDKVQMKGMKVGKWESTYENMEKAIEVGDFNYDYWPQLLMYDKITFKESATGFPFDFYLRNTAVSNSPLALVLNDTEGLDNYFTTNTISIGDIDDFENDDFEIVVSGDKVYAIGFIMRSNTDRDEEYLEVIAAQDGCYLDQLDLDNAATFKFFGVISPVPLKRLFFNEDAADDDMGIENFYFGYVPDN